MQSEQLCVTQSQRSCAHAAPQSKQHASSSTAADDGWAASLDIASDMLLLGGSLAASAALA
jgi:hypothetical protein